MQQRETKCRRRTCSTTPYMSEGVRFLDLLASLLCQRNRGCHRIGPLNFVSDVGQTILYLSIAFPIVTHTIVRSKQGKSAMNDEVLSVWIWIRIGQLEASDVDCFWKLEEQVSNNGRVLGEHHIICGTLFGCIVILLPARDQFSFHGNIVPPRRSTDAEGSDTL